MAIDAVIAIDVVLIAVVVVEPARRRAHNRRCQSMPRRRWLDARHLLVRLSCLTLLSVAVAAALQAARPVDCPC